MKVFFVDFLEDQVIEEYPSGIPVPSVNDEVWIKAKRWVVISRLYDYDNVRLQIYLKQR